VLEPHPDSKRLVLTEIHPGVELDQVREQTGWELDVSPQLDRTELPTPEELAKLRELLER
jgi:glutaconate CoA-transferase, subunit B